MRRVSAAGRRVLVCMAAACCNVRSFLPFCVSRSPQNAGGPLMSAAPIYHHYCQRTEGATRSSNVIQNTHTQAHNAPRHQIQQHYFALETTAWEFLTESGKCFFFLLIIGCCWLVGCISDWLFQRILPKCVFVFSYKCTKKPKMPLKKNEKKICIHFVANKMIFLILIQLNVMMPFV